MNQELAARLAAIVGGGHLLLDAESASRYGRDWTRFAEAAPCAVALPADSGQVQALVGLAAKARLPVVPSGGRTGLSGGALAARGELVLALERLNRIEDFNAIDRTVRCGAGVLTATLHQYASERGLLYPVDFASSGSSQLGGNVATNAGGVRVIRYGMTRDWVAGLKVVTGTGELLELNNGLVKNNSGYDLRHLLIGSEGTLGVIVEVTARLTRPAPARQVQVLGAPGMRAIMQVLEVYRPRVELSAFEFFSERALAKVVECRGLRRPFPRPAPFYALLEIEDGDGLARERALRLFGDCVERGCVSDGVMSQSEAQARELWRLREDISETLSRWTPHKHDLSVRVSLVPGFLEEVEALVAAACPEFEVVWYGHIGDGNVHLNILKPEAMAQGAFQERCAGLGRGVFEVVARYGGSVSAEHGVGLLKKDCLRYTRSAREIAIMRQLKSVFDPAGILNPGKLLD